MKYCVYVCIVLFLSWVSAFWSVFANDCQRALGSGSAEALAKLWTNTYYDAANIKIAVNHLQQYCRWLLNTQTSSVWSSTASSPYLYDHLVDIGWRALDAEPDNPYRLKLDPAGIQRQETLESMIVKADGDIPLKLSEAFQEQRTYSLLVPKTCSELKNIDLTQSKGVFNKYLLTCAASPCIEKDLKWDSSPEIPDDSTMKQCVNRAVMRYQQELAFVKSQLVIMGTAYMSTAIDAYLQWYLTQWRTMVLLENMSQLEQSLSNITRKVTGTQQCN